VYQGHFEQIKGKPVGDPGYTPTDPLNISYVPMKNSPFESMIIPASMFSASDRPQDFPPTLVSIDIRNFFNGQ
jgi:hypothetical protein